MNRLFLYNIGGEKLETIRRMALWLGLSPVVVSPAEFGCPLGFLLGEEGFAPAEASEPFSDEMLVMEALSSPLLDALRREGVPVSLKAVVTEQNKAWSAAALCRELRREHEVMRASTAQRHPHRHKRK